MQLPTTDAGALDTATIMWGMVFGSIGLGYFIYGKKNGRPVPLLAGILLSLLPLFVTDALPLVGSGAAVMAATWFLRGI